MKGVPIVEAELVLSACSTCALDVDPRTRGDRRFRPLTFELVGPVAEHLVESLRCGRHQVRMRNPGPVESIACLAVLVLFDLGERDAVDLRVAPRRNEGGHATHPVRSAPMTSLHDELF